MGSFGRGLVVTLAMTEFFGASCMVRCRAGQGKASLRDRESHVVRKSYLLALRRQ